MNFANDEERVMFMRDLIKRNKTLNKVKKSVNLPVVAIGGINENNYKKLLLNNADFLAISSYIWHYKKFKPHQAIKKLI